MNCDCQVCGRSFRDDHALYQHSKIHLPKTVSCPICGDRRFANAANAVAHVESGFCSGCYGKDNARGQIYNFVSHNAPNLRAPMIKYDQYEDASLPEKPYRCKYCQRLFGQLSSLMNHQADKHSTHTTFPQIGW